VYLFGTYVACLDGQACTRSLGIRFHAWSSRSISLISDMYFHLPIVLNWLSPICRICAVLYYGSKSSSFIWRVFYMCLLFLSFVSCARISCPFSFRFFFGASLSHYFCHTNMYPHMVPISILPDLRGNVHVGHVYKSCLKPRCRSSNIPLWYFLLQYGPIDGILEMGPHLSLCVFA